MLQTLSDMITTKIARRLISSPSGEGSAIHLASAALVQTRIKWQISDYAMVLITSGRGQYTDEASGRTWPVSAGTIIQRFPNRPHSLLMASANAAQIYLAVPKSLCDMLLISNEISISNPVLPMRLGHDRAASFIHLATMLEIPTSFYEALTACAEFIVNIHRQSTASHVQSDRIERAISIIRGHPEKRLIMSDLAKQVGMPYVTFRRLFTQLTGESPGAFAVRNRLDRAKNLLLNDHPANQVAGQLNYPDAASFSKQFKKFTGQSPSAYVANILANN